MVRTAPPSQKKARLTKEQKAAARARSDEMWNKIQDLRDHLRQKVISISNGYQRTETWVSMQLFGGGKLLRVKRKPNSYNAYLHARSKANKENGLESSGRNTLPALSTQAAHEDEWKDMPAEKKKELVDQLVAEKEEKKIIPRVKGVHASHDVGRTVATVDAELQGLSKRTGAQYALITVRDSTADTWDAQVHATDKVKSGIQDLYKATPDQMTMKLQAYSMSGMGGVLKGSGGKRRSALKGEVRAMVTQGLETILLDRGIPSDRLPKMAYSNYEALVCKYGVELAGWPEDGGIRSPDLVKLTGDMERIFVALKTKTCAWRALTPEELGARQATREHEILAGKSKAKSTGGKGKRREKGKGAKSRGRKGPSSAEFVATDEDEEEGRSEDGGDDDE